MESGQSVYLVFIILALIYGVLDFFAILRAAKLHKFTSEWRHAKIFYLSMIVQASFRITGFIVILAYLEERKTVLTFLMTAIPDSLFVLNFLLIFWQMISVFRYAHLDHHLEVSFITALSKGADKSLASRLFQAFMVLWCVLQIVLFLTYALGHVSSNAIDVEMGTVNLALAMIAMTTYCLLSRSYSGSPVKSRPWHKRLKRMNYTTMIWSLCRVFRGVIDVVHGATKFSLRGDISQLITVVIIISALIVSEILCYFLVLDYAFISIFVLTEQEVASQRLSDPSEVNSALSILPTEPQEPSFRRFPALSTEFRLKEEDVTVPKQPAGRAERHRLGRVQRGMLRQHDVAVRTIPFDHVSGYMMDEFLAEMEVLRSLEVPHLVPVYGAVLQLPVIRLVTPWLEGGSLFSFLHDRSERLSEGKVRRIATDLAVCLQGLHSLGRCHGHLTSHNVLLDLDFSAYITDIGLNKLKKFAGLSLGYSNKSAWTSPELLAERFATVMKAHAEDDAYSFGVILWEMHSGLVPFKDYSRKDLLIEVGEKHIRPEIPPETPLDLAALIHRCWNPDRTRRPDFAAIVEALEAPNLIN